MSQTEFNPRKLAVEVFAAEGAHMECATSLSAMDRLCESAQGAVQGLHVLWSVSGELREQRYGAKPQVWLHLRGNVQFPMTCQRCLSDALIPLEVEQSYRFVATEAQALEEDEDSDEDILVLSRDFDLQELLEDELIMVLPPIPKHDTCPSLPAFEVADEGFSEAEPEKPNPFAVLQKLKQKGGA